MQLTADLKPLQRAERLTPVPVTKRPRPPGWKPPVPEIDDPAPPADSAANLPAAIPPNPIPSPEVPTAIPAVVLVESTPSPDHADHQPDDFGSDIALPPESDSQGDPAE